MCASKHATVLGTLACIRSVQNGICNTPVISHIFKTTQHETQCVPTSLPIQASVDQSFVLLPYLFPNLISHSFHSPPKRLISFLSFLRKTVKMTASEMRPECVCVFSEPQSVMQDSCASPFAAQKNDMLSGHIFKRLFENMEIFNFGQRYDRSMLEANEKSMSAVVTNHITLPFVSDSIQLLQKLIIPMHYKHMYQNTSYINNMFCTY